VTRPVLKPLPQFPREMAPKGRATRPAVASVRRRRRISPMTPRKALAFVRKHGVVLESAQGPVPSLARAIAGERIRGSWWGQPPAAESLASLAGARRAVVELFSRGRS